MGFALADAFNFRRMQAIDFAALGVFVLPLFLGRDAVGEEQRGFEDLLQLRLSCGRLATFASPMRSRHLVIEERPKESS